VVLKSLTGELDTSNTKGRDRGTITKSDSRREPSRVLFKANTLCVNNLLGHEVASCHSVKGKNTREGLIRRLLGSSFIGETILTMPYLCTGLKGHFGTSDRKIIITVIRDWEYGWRK
jgi:hypothetical protein